MAAAVGRGGCRGAGPGRRASSGGRTVRRGAGRRSTAGRCTRNVVDQPGVSTMSMVPSWASTTDLAMASPRPEPGMPWSGRGGQAVEALEELGALVAGDRPGRRRAPRGARRARARSTRTATRPPAGVNLTALDRRLPRSWWRRDGVAVDHHRIRGVTREPDAALGRGGRHGVDGLAGQGGDRSVAHEAAPAGPARRPGRRAGRRPPGGAGASCGRWPGACGPARRRGPPGPPSKQQLDEAAGSR